MTTLALLVLLAMLLAILLAMLATEPASVEADRRGAGLGGGGGGVFFTPGEARGDVLALIEAVLGAGADVVHPALAPVLRVECRFGLGRGGVGPAPWMEMDGGGGVVRESGVRHSLSPSRVGASLSMDVVESMLRR